MDCKELQSKISQLVDEIVQEDSLLANLDAVDKLTQLYVRSANIAGYIEYRKQAEQAADEYFQGESESQDASGIVLN